MRKLSLLIVLAMLLTIGGVYATWTYAQTTDVADDSDNVSLHLTGVAFADGYGVYEIDQSGLLLQIDPKEDTAHTTALYVTGDLVIRFTPSAYAPAEVKENGVESFYMFTATSDWLYEDEDVVSIADDSVEVAIDWTKEDDGTFTYTFDADALAEIIDLTEFDLDTKAKYDDYNDVLSEGSIIIKITDGQTTAA